MLLLNFAHPLTEDQLKKVEKLTGRSLDQVVDLDVQFDHQQPYQPQMSELLATIPLDPKGWQTNPILVNLPSLNFIAGLLLAELHGRMGYFPPIIRLRPIQGSLPPSFEVAEILNLQSVRDAARRKRA